MIVIRGAGDIATGIAVRLYNAHMPFAMTEAYAPTSIRRTVCFSEAVRLGETEVEGIRAIRTANADEANAALRRGFVPVFADPEGKCIKALSPVAVVDAILAKTNLGTSITDAPLVIGIGPGFTAGVDCHAVIETMRGHTLGRVIVRGAAKANTGVPGSIGGFTTERIIRAPKDGIFIAAAHIGDEVNAGDIVAYVSDEPVTVSIAGVLRGLLPDNTPVHAGMKSGDVDPRCELSHCYTVSDKALAVGGGVLEALLRFAGISFPLGELISAGRHEMN